MASRASRLSDTRTRRAFNGAARTQQRPSGPCGAPPRGGKQRRPVGHRTPGGGAPWGPSLPPPPTPSPPPACAAHLLDRHLPAVDVVVARVGARRGARDGELAAGHRVKLAAVLRCAREEARCARRACLGGSRQLCSGCTAPSPPPAHPSAAGGPRPHPLLPLLLPPASPASHSFAPSLASPRAPAALSPPPAPPLRTRSMISWKCTVTHARSRPRWCVLLWISSDTLLKRSCAGAREGGRGALPPGSRGGV